MNKRSYGSILKSSSVIGGAEGVTSIFNLIRVKFVAVIIGVEGIGLMGMYNSLIRLTNDVVGLGITQSGVRQVAVANGQGDVLGVVKTVASIRAVIWICGFIGALFLLLFAPKVSLFTFGDDTHVLAIRCLALAVLLINISNGQKTVIQGLRRVNYLALSKIIGGAFSCVISILIFYFMGRNGIVPTLLSAAVVNVAISWYFMQRVGLQQSQLELSARFSEVRSLLSLGAAFMFNAILVSAVAYGIRVLIYNGLGEVEAGLYVAAFGISGLLVKFVLKAMGTDFYPRLTEAIGDVRDARRLINEQTEIGVLIAVPLLIAFLFFAPLAIYALYTKEFLSGLTLLRLFTIGCFFRVFVWPMGYVQLAMGKGAFFAATQLLSNFLHVLFVWLGLKLFGLVGAAAAFVLMNATMFVVIKLIAFKLIGFSWSRDVWCLCFVILSIVMTSAAVIYVYDGVYEYGIGLVLSGLTSIYCLVGLVERLGEQHSLSRLYARLPLMPLFARKIF